MIGTRWINTERSQMTIKDKTIHVIRYIEKNGRDAQIYFTTKDKAAKFYKDLVKNTTYKPRIKGDFDKSYGVIKVE
ncbi:hypothetical protein LCGC14_1107340 [marine sediment metagenome]|uniref:Uncharacterized protein n=1 Tax=marine sediment metagenome TaxID=412755 RepID=A0A0F9M7S3_9ZZZZ